jgi:PAS domain S-box-containing protein
MCNRDYFRISRPISPGGIATMTSQELGERPRILVVDDDAALRRGTSRLLASAGYDVGEAATGADGLRLTKEQRPDLTLLDVVLPDLNGVEVCRRIKSDPALAGCCVVLLSGLKTSEDDQAEGLASGADDYIVRPISERELVARVHVMLRLKRTQEALRQSEQRYRLLADNAPLAVAVIDVETSQVVYANSLAAILFETTVAQALGTQAPDYYVDPHDRDRLVGQLTAQGRVNDFEVRLKKRSGQEFWASITSTLSMFENRPAIHTVYLDITERKQAEEVLRQSEARYRLLAENMVDVVWMLNPAGQFTYVSPSVQRLRGYTPQEVLSQSAAEALTPASLQIMQAALAATMPYLEKGERHHGLEPAAYELEQPCKDGSTVWTEALVRALFDNGGSFSGFLGVSRDISERKKAGEQLRLQSAALEAAADGIVITDREGRIVWANPAFSRLTGYSLQEAQGQNPRFLKSGRQDRPFYQALWETILSGQVWRGELINRRKDGSLYSEAMVITPLQDSDGAVTHFIAIKQDVTERKRVEAQYRLLFETMAQGVVYLDASGRVASANPAAERILGLSSDQLQGQITFDPRRETIHEDGSPFPGDSHPAMVAFRTGKPVSDVVMGFLPPGSQELRWINVNAIPLFIPGESKPYQVYATFNDITARKQATDQLRASLDEKVVLLQEIHHRVKNNLQVISSLLDMQAMRSLDPLAAQVLQDSQNRVRAMALVHEKLYRSQDLSSIDIAEYVRGVTGYLLGMYADHSRGVSLNVQVDDVSLDLDMAIPCGLIINELVSNALKYAFPSGEGGTLSEGGPPDGDRRDEICVQLRAQENGRLALVVSDNGVGLPPGLDLNSPESLGLRLVSMLAQQLRGSLELDRSGGTRFTITFPGAGRKLIPEAKP